MTTTQKTGSASDHVMTRHAELVKARNLADKEAERALVMYGYDSDKYMAARAVLGVAREALIAFNRDANRP